MGGMIPSAAMTALQMGMDVAQQKSAEKEAKAEARAQTQQIQQTQAIATRQRQDQLRRALATQRARFGAQGVAAGSGSAEAALGGLEAEATREDAESRSLGELRIGRLSDQSIGSDAATCWRRPLREPDRLFPSSSAAFARCPCSTSSRLLAAFRAARQDSPEFGESSR